MKNVISCGTRKIACPFILAESGKFLRNAIVEFSPEGKVVSVESDVPDIDSRPGVEYYNGILIPGMVNAHCHLELSYFKGLIPQHTGLVQFVNHVISHREDLPVEGRIKALQFQDKIMWNDGTQAVGDISNDLFSFETKAASPIYYHTFVEYFGMPPAEKASEIFDHAASIAEKGHETGIATTVTPHSTYLVSDALFKMGADSSRMSIHFMETPSEVELFDRKGGMYQFIIENGMKPDFLQYGSHSKRLVESLHKDTPLLLVHNTMIRREDVERILGHFSDVTFVLCPRSNYYIENAMPPAVMLRDMGCRIALGTDSLCSNTSLSIVEEVKYLIKNYPSLTLETVLKWAVSGGAEGIGISDKTGSFTTGKIPGAVLLSDIDWKNFRTTDKTTSRRIL